MGVGPDNFELNYLSYLLGIDPRPEQRGAHNLYLESLAETGLLERFALFAIIALPCAGVARARASRAGMPCWARPCSWHSASIVTALTLNSAYARSSGSSSAWAWSPAAWPGGRLRDGGAACGQWSLVAWVYAGYPLALMLLDVCSSRPRFGAHKA